MCVGKPEIGGQRVAVTPTVIYSLVPSPVNSFRLTRLCIQPTKLEARLEAAAVSVFVGD